VSAIPGVSGTFNPDAWQEVPGFEDLTDVTYHRAVGVGCVRVAFDRPEVLNAFRPHTVDELYRVLDHADLEAEALQVAREVMGKSPQAQRMLKFAFNLVDDGLMGQQVFAGEATRLAYMTDEAVEGRDQFLEKRDPDWSPFPWYF